MSAGGTRASSFRVADRTLTAGIHGRVLGLNQIAFNPFSGGLVLGRGIYQDVGGTKPPNRLLPDLIVAQAAFEVGAFSHIEDLPTANRTAGEHIDRRDGTDRGPGIRHG